MAVTPERQILVFESIAAFFASLFALLGVAAGSGTDAHLRAPASFPATPHRIVSLNMCADQYLIELADKGQVAALSEYARDPNMSFHAARAMQFPVSRASGEELLALRPDLVIGAGYQRPLVEALFGDRPVAFLEFELANNRGDMIAQTRRIAAAIGHADRGEALVQRIDAAVTPVDRARPRPIVAYYQRRGYLTGTGTLVDEIMQRAGAINLAEKLGKPSLHRLSLEEMVAARPDFLLLDGESAIIADQGREMLHHPALRAIPRLMLEESFTVCDGPSYPYAIRKLRAQLDAARR